MTTQKLLTTEILTMNILALKKEEILESLCSSIRSRQMSYTCMPNVYSSVLYKKNSTFRKALSSADFLIADGVPLVWISSLKGHKVSRIRGSDLLLSLCELSREDSFSHYFYGGAPGVADMLSIKLRERFPWLNVVGTHSPPYRPVGYEEDGSFVEEINGINPDILWVGLGAPKQEIWMYDHRDKLDVTMLIGVGAAFDFLSEKIKPAPKWIQDIGFEWIFRLIKEPRRLWRRYLWSNTIFVYLAFLDLLKMAHRKVGRY
jgi:N-acetylglucosaminyldiphosphoundecaprenol N-acetyl-beta-D-mannosaminyltransferase